MSKRLSRRDFSKLACGSSVIATAAQAAGAMPARPLGRTGFRAGILGLGAQRLADRPLEQSVANRMIAELLDGGLNYIDTARGYLASEEMLGQALKGKRDTVFLVTKTRQPDREGTLRELRESLRLLGTDHVDCVHIHNIARDDRFPNLEEALSEKGVLGGLMEAKRLGMTKHIGCTAHLRPLRVLPVFATGQVELFMCSMNFVERHIYNFEERILPEAKKRGIGVVAMKVLGGPTGTTNAKLTDPADYQASLRYVWGLPDVSVAVLGMRSLQEVRQALAAARAYHPLNSEEMSSVMERGKLLAQEWGTLRGPVV